MNREWLLEEKLTHSVVGCFYESYNTLGYGHREHVYIMALERELLARGHRVARELVVTIYYKGEELTSERIDMVVDDRLVVEVKSTQELHKAAQRQVFSYLAATRFEVGLLLHYGPTAKFYRFICTNDQKPHPKQSV